MKNVVFIQYSSFPPFFTKPLPVENTRSPSHTTQHNLSNPTILQAISCQFPPTPSEVPSQPTPSLPSQSRVLRSQVRGEWQDRKRHAWAKTKDWLPWTQSSWQNVFLCSLNCILVPCPECFPLLWSYQRDAAALQNSLEISCLPQSQPSCKQA